MISTTLFPFHCDLRVYTTSEGSGGYWPLNILGLGLTPEWNDALDSGDRQKLLIHCVQNIEFNKHVSGT